MFQAEQVEKLLCARRLTLHRVSRLSAEIFGRRSRFYVPHNLYAELSASSSGPSVYQVLALSHITRYRMVDWLAALGIKLETISRLQLLCPFRRTTLLDATVYDPGAWVPFFRERHPAARPAIAPFPFLFEHEGFVRAGEFLAPNRRAFLYARIGEEDQCARPEFSPGTIIRADAKESEAWLQKKERDARGRFFLVEHELGWSCSRLVRVGGNRVLLSRSGRPFRQRELRIGEDARVLGLVDAEVRQLASGRAAPFLEAEESRQRRLAFSRAGRGLEALLRASRRKTGWSFREAAAASRTIAEVLFDARYFVAASTLSDYEALSSAPRQIQKIVTLCALYAIPFWRFLEACGLPVALAGQEPAPDALVRRAAIPEPVERRTPAHKEGGGPRNALLEEWGEIPFFLRHSLDLITGIHPFSLSDVFWVGGILRPIHPTLAQASFVAVNRRRRKPAGNCEEQALCVVLKRDGTFLCEPCALEQESLMVGCEEGRRRFRNHVDAEIIGRLTAVLRRIA